MAPEAVYNLAAHQSKSIGHLYSDLMPRLQVHARHHLTGDLGYATSKFTLYFAGGMNRRA
jgi:hypothetical protein